MIRWVLVIVACVCALLCATGCKPKAGAATADKYAQLMASDFGLQIKLGMTLDQVHAVLGQPASKEEHPGGTLVLEHYLPEGESSISRDAPQLTLTFAGGKLVRLFNVFQPGDKTVPSPPFFITPLEGVKLGASRGDLVTLLGQPGGSKTTSEWKYTDAEGNFVGLLAQYSEIKGQAEDMCTSLTVVSGAALAEDRGEALDKPSWRDLGQNVKEGTGK